MPKEEFVYGWDNIGKVINRSGRQAKRYLKNHINPIPVERKAGRYRAERHQLELWMGLNEPRPERVALAGDSIVAFDGLGSALWRHKFADRLRKPDGEEKRWRFQIAEFPNGRRRVLAAIAPLLPGGTDLAGRDELYCFSEDGKQEWRVSANPGLSSLGDRPLADAWRFTHLLCANDGVWISGCHLRRAAGYVMRVDVEGKLSVQFVNPGFVEYVDRVPRRDGDLIVACGVNNAYSAAFLAGIGIDDPPSRAPESVEPPFPENYRYADAPSGSVRSYVLFPTTEMLKAQDKPYGHAFRIQVVDELVEVGVQSGIASEGANPALFFVFDSILRPRWVYSDQTHDACHERLAKRGLLGHPLGTCPEMAVPALLTRWDQEQGWWSDTIPWRGTTTITPRR